MTGRSAEAAHFDAFGFLVLRSCYSPAEIATIRGRVDGIVARARQDNGQHPDLAGYSAEQQDEELEAGEAPWDDMANPFLEIDDVLTRLCVADRRVAGVMAELLGQDYIFCGSEFNCAGAPRFLHHMSAHPEATAELGLPADYSEHGW